MSNNYDLIVDMGLVRVELEKILHTHDNSFLGTVRAKVQFQGHTPKEGLLRYDEGKQRFIDHLGDYFDAGTPRSLSHDKYIAELGLRVSEVFTRFYNAGIIKIVP